MKIPFKKPVTTQEAIMAIADAINNVANAILAPEDYSETETTEILPQLIAIAEDNKPIFDIKHSEKDIELTDLSTPNGMKLYTRVDHNDFYYYTLGQ